MKDYNKKRVLFILKWGLGLSALLYIISSLALNQWKTNNLIVPGLFFVIMVLISFLLFESPTYKEKEKRPGKYYVSHLKDMNPDIRTKVEKSLKEIHPLIKLTEDMIFGDVIIEMPSYTTHEGLFAIHHRKYKIIFDDRDKDVKFELNNVVDKRLLLAITWIAVGLGWYRNTLDAKDLRDLEKFNK